MDLDIIEINLDLVKEEQIFEEIEEKKIELVDNKDIAEKLKISVRQVQRLKKEV